MTSLVKALTSLNVSVSGKAFVLPLGKSPDTSDESYLADLCESFVRKIGQRSTCSWFSVHGSSEILDEGPARIFELVYKLPYLTNAEWGFQVVRTSGVLKLAPAVEDVVNIDSSATGPSKTNHRQEKKAAPDEVLSSRLSICVCVPCAASIRVRESAVLRLGGIVPPATENAISCTDAVPVQLLYVRTAAPH